MIVSGIASAFGESLKTHTAKSIFSQVNDSKVITKESLEDILKSQLSPEYIEKYKEAANIVTPKYYRYLIIGYAVQAILIIGIAMAASFITISIVKRSVKL